MMNGTHFVKMPCFDTDSQANLCSGVVLISPLNAKESVDKFLKTEKHLIHYEFATTYTVGYEGQEEHIWDFSHHEVYEPVDTDLPSIVILRYRRRHFNKVCIEHSKESFFQLKEAIHLSKDCIKENVATEL